MTSAPKAAHAVFLRLVDRVTLRAKTWTVGALDERLESVPATTRGVTPRAARDRSGPVR